MSAVPPGSTPGAGSMPAATQDGSPSGPPTVPLWLRRWSCILTSKTTGTGVQLTCERPGFDLRMTFQTSAVSDFKAGPPTAIVRVYNLSDQTAQNVINEFDTLVLQAGYLNGPYGVIFKGDIKQFKRGKENATDSYLDIFAADMDFARLFATLNTTLAPGAANSTQIAQTIVSALQAKDPSVSLGYMNIPFGGIAVPRGKTLSGWAINEAMAQGTATGTVWFVENGVVNIVPAGSYLPGQAVQINSGSGMIGQPEVTNNGILVTTLINPAIKQRSLIQINNADINQFFAPEGGPAAGVQFPGYTPQFYARVTEDGIYVVLVREHIGDTRGNPWYSMLTCLAVDSTTAPGVAVPAGAYGNYVGPRGPGLG